jgi:DNA-binding NtrC family response regulator
VGGDSEVGFDARVLAATNRDLESAIEEGRFRQDLYYRLNVIEIPLPPLRTRGNDVLLLTQHAIERCSRTLGKNVTGISAEAASRLLRYDWPGNVRELFNCIERGVTLARGPKLELDDLPERIVEHDRKTATARPLGEELLPLAQVERRYIEHVLRAFDGNRTEAARVLGLDRKTLYRKLGRRQRNGD